MKKKLPPRRYTESREAYWRSIFNDFSRFDADHAVSGWSAQGLRLRMDAFVQKLPEFGLAQEARVLDLGCGAGAYARIMGKNGFHVTGLDFAWQVVQKARKKNTLAHVHFITGDATALPFSDNVFNHILCIGLFQSLHDYPSAISEILRILKPGGVLCLMTLNRRNIKDMAERFFKKEEVIMVDGFPQSRLNTYDPDKFKNRLKQAGFERIHHQPVQIYPEKLNRLKYMINIWNRLPGLNYLTARSFMICAFRPQAI